MQIHIKENQREEILLEDLKTGEIILEKKANATIIAFLTQGWREERVITFRIKGEEAKLHFICLIIGKNHESFPFKTIALHEKGKSQSHYFVDSALFDRSQIAYEGLLKIAKNAQHTDTSLAHNTLMLSPSSKTQSIPSLEIEADDVSAGHSATIGNIDEELIFYLQTRGIDSHTAKLIMVKGFLATNLDKIASPKIRAELNKKIEEAI